jgi:hypothetical protein
MNLQLQSMTQLNKAATDALIKEIGVVDTLRFLSQFRVGTGDYTAERHQLFQDMSLEEIIRDIKAQE